MQCQDIICIIERDCEQAAKELEPVSLLMSGYRFELKPEAYLMSSEPGWCYVGIEGSGIKGMDDFYLVGDTFLRHFYSVYNFDDNTIGLGVNKHSKGLVSMSLYDNLD